MEKKTDLRIIKTKKVIYEALIDLMKEKTFEEIKVSDICNKALINRSTFYAHYEDKYELLVEFINDLKSNFTNELDKRKHITDTRDYYMELIKLFIDHVEEYRDIYSSIMTNNRNSIMMDILLSVINEDISKKIKNDKRNSSIPKVIIAKFYLGGLLSLGIEWLENTNKYTKEEIYNFLNKLIPENIESIFLCCFYTVNTIWYIFDSGRF